MNQLFKLKNGTVLLSTEAPGGVYNSGQLKKIAELCSKELAVVKATEDQRLALFVKESEVQKVIAQLQTMGLGVRNYQAGLHQPIACLGELCEQHEQPALASAMDLTKAISDIALKSSLKIGINGCAQCCTPCHTFDISILGEPSGYRISLGGKNSQFPELSSFFAEAVPAKELPRLIKAVIQLFEKHAEDGETLHSVLERCGTEDFVQALAPYSQDAAHRDDPFASPADDSDLLGAPASAPAPQEDEISLADDEDLKLDGIEDEDSISFDEEAGSPASSGALIDSDADLDGFSLEDDGGGDGELEEIPIEKEAGSTLGDDISLMDDEAGLGSDIILEDSALPEDDLSLDPDLLEEEAIPMPSPTRQLAKSTAAALPEVEEDDSLIELESEELAFDEVSPPDVQPLEFENVSFEEDLEASPLEEGRAADSSIDAINFDEIDESAELDPSLQLDSEIELLEEPDSIELEDEEGIPELDGGLDPDAFASKPEPLAQVSPAAAIPEDTFDEGLEFESLSDEEESHFEAKLHASIEEEARLLADVEEDPNETDRQAALHLLENHHTAPSEATPQELHPSQDAGNKRAKTKTLEMPRAVPATKGRALRFAGVDFADGQMRLSFTSGAYVDIDLSSLATDEERVLSLGGIELKVVQSEAGCTVELDGMRMFYPSNTLQVAS